MSDFSEYSNKRQSVTDVLRWSDMCYPVIPEYPVDVGCGGEFLGTTFSFTCLECSPNCVSINNSTNA